MSLFPTTVHLHGARGDEWERILGTRDFRVLSPLPTACNLPGFGTPQYCYMLDIASLSAEQKERLSAHMSQKFGVPLEEVEADMVKYGIPIHERDCSVSFDVRLVL